MIYQLTTACSVSFCALAETHVMVIHFWELDRDVMCLLLLIGCSAKLPFCKSNPCQNGGTCSVSWETFSCDCPLGYGGKDCSHGERLYEFISILGSYMLHFQPMTTFSIVT